MAMTLDLERPFATVPDLIRQNARERPRHAAIVQDNFTDQPARSIDYRTLDALMDRVAAALQRDGVAPRQSIAVCGSNSIEYAVLFLGALRAGVAIAPLAPSSTAESIARMTRDSGAKIFFDEDQLKNLEAWLAPAGAKPRPVDIQPEWPFNIIYSSGTTGEPKGIVHPHAMRWAHVRRAGVIGYGPDAITLLSTPLYSNTTLVSFLPTVALGGTVILMPKFEARAYLGLAQKYRATHTMLVPVQYQRIMALPDFGKYDLSSFRMKRCTSAPFAAALKKQVVERWPGKLVDSYGLTEGGGTCMLDCTEYPDKLHTVGRPAPGHDIRLIDENGREVGPGQAGEVVGHSPGIMTGYHNQPAKTKDAEWYDPSGKRFIRTGDIGRFDAEGFLTLVDRKKDMIISGGFNIYPSDLEAVLKGNEFVSEVSVVGVPSEQWGETPVAFVVLKNKTEAKKILDWANQRLGKTQRLSDLRIVEALPRSAIGKILKRELRDAYST
jgi:acyl-CoA synthetase (AMP-forming)/AMP-acid ligase II